MDKIEGYEKLLDVLSRAYHQASGGKGAERHANDQPFHDQRMQTLSKLLDSPDGMAFQAMKKVTEGLGLPTVERQVAEMLGAIVYISGIVVFLEAKQEAEKAAIVGQQVEAHTHATTLPELQAAGVWIDWRGGPRPVGASTPVRVKLSSGDHCSGYAEEFMWDLADTAAIRIVAYRVMGDDRA